MLFDIAYREDPLRREITFHRHGAQGHREVRGYAEALFFDAEVKQGILTIPAEHYRLSEGTEERDA